MERVGVSMFRKNMTVLLRKVQTGQSITITSRGHDLVRLAPLEDNTEKSKRILKQLGETAVIGDVLSPIGEQWEVIQ